MQWGLRALERCVGGEAIATIKALKTSSFTMVALQLSLMTVPM